MVDVLGSAAGVAERVLNNLADVVRAMGDAYRVHVPEYAALSPEAMETEVLPVSRDVVETFFKAVVKGQEPRVEDVPGLEAMGRRRLEMGVPLEPMLHVYRVAGRTVWDAVVAATEEGEERALAVLGRAWMDFIDRASSAAASGYLDASHERLRRIDAHRGALLHALLGAADATDVAAVAAEFSTTFAAGYIPVLLAADNVTSRIDRVAAACPNGTISGFRGNHLVLLVPDRLPDLREVRREALGATAAYGHPAAPGAPLTAELRQTDSLLTVALTRGRDGTFGPDDLLLDQVLAASPRVLDALQRLVLTPLRAADRGGLVESTLRHYLASGSIPSTAEAEVVHPNTVAYRLKRVAERTGLDPRIPNEASLLVMALNLMAPPPPGTPL